MKPLPAIPWILNFSIFNFDRGIFPRRFVGPLQTMPKKITRIVGLCDFEHLRGDVLVIYLWAAPENIQAFFFKTLILVWSTKMHDNYKKSFDWKI